MMYKGAVAPKTALPYGRDSCIAWNRCHIFTNKRGTYGIIADGLRFDTQLSNVYGNAIRAKLAVAQTERSFLYNACFPRLTVSTAPADVPHLKRPAPPLRPSRRTIIPEWG